MDLPAVYVEHNTPRAEVPNSRNPLADQSEIWIVHVTHFNALFWDTRRCPTAVVEHGVVDPGPRYTGELPRAAVVISEPLRRGRVTGTDLLPSLSATATAPLDLFGMGVSDAPAALGLPAGALTPYDDLPQHEMHAALARRRVYVHPLRWTSLGLSLIEAMHLGMPMVALATTAAADAVPPGAGVVSTQPSALAAGVRRYLADPAAAADADCRGFSMTGTTFSRR